MSEYLTAKDRLDLASLPTQDDSTIRTTARGVLRFVLDTGNLVDPHASLGYYDVESDESDKLLGDHPIRNGALALAGACAFVFLTDLDRPIADATEHLRVAIETHITDPLSERFANSIDVTLPDTQSISHYLPTAPTDYTLQR